LSQKTAKITTLRLIKQ